MLSLATIRTGEYINKQNERGKINDDEDLEI